MSLDNCPLFIVGRLLASASRPNTDDFPGKYGWCDAACPAWLAGQVKDLDAFKAEGKAVINRDWSLSWFLAIERMMRLRTGAGADRTGE